MRGLDQFYPTARIDCQAKNINNTSMTHRFPIKEIALQSGLSTATIDRALNGRAHVSPQTRERVKAAISELEAQEQQLSARGRRLFVDIIVEAPQRFTTEVRAACEAVLTETRSAVFRPRFHFFETLPEPELLTLLHRIEKRGTQGICIKARNAPAIQSEINRLATRGLPIFTLVTDILPSQRMGYLGLNNRRAGQTAAYLMARSLMGRTGVILTTRSRDEFFGEAERHEGFLTTLSDLRPDLRIVDVSGGGGLFSNTLGQMADVATTEEILGVYSMGGGNRAILTELSRGAHRRPFFIAHDLDKENLSLLDAGQLDFVLYHDLGQDMRHLFHRFAAAHGLAPDHDAPYSSDIQVVTPFNVPRHGRASTGVQTPTV